MSNDIAFLLSTASIKSTDDGEPGRFKLTNDSKEKIYLSWIDFTGSIKQYAVIDPGQSYVQLTTQTSHAWQVSSDSGNVAFKFFPTVYGNIDVKGSGTPVFESFANATVHTDIGNWNTYTGYGLINVGRSLGIADTGDDGFHLGGKNNNVALELINAPVAWKNGFTGKGVKVAVIDSGIADNPEIHGKIVDQWDFRDNDSDASPTNGAYKDHSLGVASIIAANHDNKGNAPDTSGVAPDASLLNVRVSSPEGARGDDIAKGIIWSVDHGADVLCIPLQGAGDGYDQSIHDALKYAADHNVVSVVIGGNFGIYGGSGIGLAAKEGLCITVGNYDVNVGDPFGSSNLPGNTPFDWVMASSTGYVPNSHGGYTFYMDGGTSFAGPYVAGLAALLVQKYPDASAKFIMDKIVEGATGVPNDGSSRTGTALADKFINTNIGEHFFGKEGTDTVSYGGNQGDYTVANTNGVFTVTDNHTKVVDAFSSVERIQFSDHAVALDIDGNAGQVYRLYQAAFDRKPDVQGLGFWINAMDKGMTLEQVAKGFLDSPEMKRVYGDTSDKGFITNLYNNVLHRAADQGGFDWHVDNLSHGVSRVQELIGFSESAENVANLVGVINHGIDFVPVI
jgi:subtilisin family serine protease